jgi:dodecin
MGTDQSLSASFTDTGCEFGNGTRQWRHPRGGIMATIVKVIEVIAQSEKSWDDAVKNALDEVAKTVDNVKEIWVSGMKAIVEEGRITEYRLTAKVSFVVKGHDQA